MNTKTYRILDIATYEWIEISNLPPSQISNSTQNSSNSTRLVAKWHKNDNGQLYCYWSSS